VGEHTLTKVENGRSRGGWGRTLNVVVGRAASSRVREDRMNQYPPSNSYPNTQEPIKSVTEEKKGKVCKDSNQDNMKTTPYKGGEREPEADWPRRTGSEYLLTTKNKIFQKRRGSTTLISRRHLSLSCARKRFFA